MVEPGDDEFVTGTDGNIDRFRERYVGTDPVSP